MNGPELTAKDPPPPELEPTRTGMRSLRQKFLIWWSVHRFSILDAHPIAKLPWSSIRRIGQSRLLALTVAIPFLGSLLLFNQHVVDLFTLSPEVVRRLLPSQDSTEGVRHLTLARLYYLYFGLTALGVGSTLFGLLCPLDIKTYESSRAFIEAESPLASKVRMALIFPSIIDQYQYWFGQIYIFQATALTRTIGTPNEYRDIFYEAISQMYEKYSSDDDWSDADNSMQFRTGARGVPDVEALSDAMMSGPGRGLLSGFVDLAAKDEFKNDVLTLRYTALDHSSPWARLTVIVFYGIGFVLLLIPTVITFVQLALSVFR